MPHFISLSLFASIPLSMPLTHANGLLQPFHALSSQPNMMACSRRRPVLPLRRILALSLFLLGYSRHTPTSLVDASYADEPSALSVFFGSKAVRRTCLAATVCCVPLFCLKIITTCDECLVERFGKYNRKLGPGWHLILPPFESISFQATTREQVLDVPPQQCYTLDNAPIRADAVVYLRLTSIEAARYNVEDVRNAILNLCLTQLREEVGKLTLDESFSSRERINKELLKDLNAVANTWGFEITRVELQNMEPSKDILAAMELQMAAERKKRAAILKSEGERMTLINEAEGRASAAVAAAEAQRTTTILKAQAEAERQRIEAEGLKVAINTVARALVSSYGDGHEGSAKDSVEGAIQFLGLLRYLETQGKFAASDGTKVLMLPSKNTLPMTYGGLKFLLDEA